MEVLICILDENTDDPGDAQSLNEEDFEDDDFEQNEGEEEATLEEVEEETFEVSESFEESQKRIEDENKAAELAERRAAREKARNDRANAARRSVSFQGQEDQEDSPLDITINEGVVETPPRKPIHKSALKRKDRGSVGGSQGSSDRSQKILKISEMYPPSDWPLGMTREQVHKNYVNSFLIKLWSQVDCLTYDQYEKVKERQLKEKQMEKEAKPLPGKTGFFKKTRWGFLIPGWVFRLVGEETFSGDPKATHKGWLRRRHNCVHSGQVGENAGGAAREMVARAAVEMARANARTWSKGKFNKLKNIYE